jgi:hypothetical protein
MLDNPLQIVTEWMPGGQAIKYVQNHGPPDRVSLASSPFYNTRDVGYNPRLQYS